ncbi:hypothetical protein QJR30_01560 [Paraclostridium sordellii]|uniref:hypothetical protein n=1 Tax=Paraclostridium sordellii TaxID=1505 RepID=UPI0030CFF376
MKVYNPYIDKKIKIKRDTNIKSTEILFKALKKRNEIQKKLGIKINHTNKLNRWYESMNRENNISEVDRIEKDINLKITDIFIEDLIAIDKIDLAKNGLNKFLNKFHNHIWTNNDVLEDFVLDIKSNYKTGRWSNIGIAQFDDNHKLSKYIEYINLNLESFTSSLVRINIHINLKERYDEELKSILDHEYEDVYSLINYKGYSRNIFKSINVIESNGETYRREDVQNKLIYLKYMVLDELSKYVPLYFHSRRIIPPSIEFFEGKLVFGDSSRELNSYLEGLGINKYIGFKHGCSKDLKWEVYEEIFKTNFDSNSMKFIVDKEKIKERWNGDFLGDKQDISRYMFIPLILETISKDIYNCLGHYKIQISKNIKEKFKYKHLFNIRYDIEKASSTLSNLIHEISFTKLNKKKMKLETYFDFIEDKNIVNNLFRSSEKMLNELEKDIDLNRKLIDDTISLLSIKSNRKAQTITIVLTVITVLLTIATLVLTWISINNTKI